MYHVDVKPKMIVPDFIRQIARHLLSKNDTDEHQEFLNELVGGLIDAQKWQVENEEEFLQF